MLRNDMRVTMMLADSAQAVGGKLYILGGGWNLTGPAPTPSAIVMYVQIPWEQTNVRHPWKLELLDEDGQPVLVSTPIGEKPLVLEGQLEAGRPPGVRHGSHIGLPVALNLGPLPLQPGKRYVWQLWINNETDENWRLPFDTRTMPPTAMPGSGMMLQPPPSTDEPSEGDAEEPPEDGAEPES